MMGLGEAAQAKGPGLSVFVSVYRVMASVSCHTLVTLRCFSCLVASSLKKRSTRSCQKADVRVKWNFTRGEEQVPTTLDLRDNGLRFCCGPGCQPPPGNSREMPQK